MKLLKVNPINPEKEKIREAAKVIRSDGLVIYPTETVYGLGSNPFSTKAVAKVFEAKGREKKPISIAVKDMDHAKKIAEFNPAALRLAKKFLPGPLTLILPQKAEFPEELTAGSDSIGIRIPDHAVAQALLREVGALTATSANISGRKSPVTAAEAIEQVGDKVDLVLDAGPCKLGVSSTIVDCTNGIRVLREGAVSKEDVSDV